MNLKKLISEFRRRNVFKVATVYAIVGWLLIQISTWKHRIRNLN